MSAQGEILVVDDQPASLSVLCAALEGADYRVMATTNGAAGLKIAADKVPDLVLLDVQMPGLDGCEVCRRLKADPATRDIPVLFLTGQDESSSLVAGLQAGAVDYITKPLVGQEVLARSGAAGTGVEDVLRRLRSMIEADRAASSADPAAESAAPWTP